MHLAKKPQTYNGKTIKLFTDRLLTIQDCYGDYSFQLEHNEFKLCGKNVVKYAKENYYQYLM